MIDAIAVGAPIDKLARYFEYWLLRLQGVYPAAVVRRVRGGALARGRDAAAGAHVRVPAVRAIGWGDGPLGHGDAVPGRRRVGGAGEARTVVAATAASRELETAHRRLIGLHLEKELKSARVLREMRHSR